jgi:hypothetical protein
MRLFRGRANENSITDIQNKFFVYLQYQVKSYDFQCYLIAPSTQTFLEPLDEGGNLLCVPLLTWEEQICLLTRANDGYAFNQAWISSVGEFGVKYRDWRGLTIAGYPIREEWLDGLWKTVERVVGSFQ